VPQLHDQHDQQADARDVQGPEHQRPHQDPAPPDRSAIEKTDQLQLHHPQAWTCGADSEQMPQHDDPAKNDGRPNECECRPKRARGRREQEEHRDADDDRERDINQKRHEALAEGTRLHPRRQACLAIRATLYGRFHEQLLVVGDCFAGETLLRNFNQYRHSITELNDSTHFHWNRLAWRELLTIAGPGRYQDRSVRGVQIGYDNLPVVGSHL
jgi:hypothetical protein